MKNFSSTRARYILALVFLLLPYSFLGCCSVGEGTWYHDAQKAELVSATADYQPAGVFLGAPAYCEPSKDLFAPDRCYTLFNEDFGRPLQKYYASIPSELNLFLVLTFQFAQSPDAADQYISFQSLNKEYILGGGTIKASKKKDQLLFILYIYLPSSIGLKDPVGQGVFEQKSAYNQPSVLLNQRLAPTISGHFLTTIEREPAEIYQPRTGKNLCLPRADQKETALRLREHSFEATPLQLQPALDAYQAKVLDYLARHPGSFANPYFRK